MYKKESDLKYSVDIKQEDGKIKMLFSADCGKFGTDEILDEHTLEPKQLLEILQANEDKQPEASDISDNVRLRFSEFCANQKDIDPGFVDIVNKNFWDLL